MMQLTEPCHLALNFPLMLPLSLFSPHLITIKIILLLEASRGPLLLSYILSLPLYTHLSASIELVKRRHFLGHKDFNGQFYAQCKPVSLCTMQFLQKLLA